MRRKIRWLAAIMGLMLATMTVSAQAQVRVVVDRDFVNLRLVPALGAEVLGSANAGTTFIADARSADNEWLRIDFGGNEAWVSLVVVTVLEGDVQALPVRNPRLIPFGGFEAPRAGFVDEDRESGIAGRLPDTGVRVRSGPSRGYRVLADAPRLTAFPLFGRTASSEWVQVNYEGTLGWVSAQYVEILGNRQIIELPIGGIVADEPPLESSDENDLFGTLRYMRERIDLAQPSLDNQRMIWTNAALGVLPPCGGYPARPSDVNIPVDLRQRYAGTLEPIIRDFDKAMLNVRNAIDLQIEVCQEPGSELVLISAPVVTGGLEFVDEADVLFASLRRRIDELLPEISPDECVFEFAGRVDVLPLFPEQAVVEGEFTGSERAFGYCFDASPLNVGYLEFVRESSNYEVVIAVSPLDNPTNFIASASASASPTETSTTLTPIQFPFTGRYLLIISADAPPGEVPEGRWAMVLIDAALGEPTDSLITFDEAGNVVRTIVPVRLPDGTIVGGDTVGDVETGATVTNIQAVPINVYEQPDTASTVVGQLLPGQTIPATGTAEGFGFIQVQFDEQTSGFVQEELVQLSGAGTADDTGTVTCPGVFLTCNDLISCAEVQACVDAGSTLLDPNGNGIACDSAEGSPPLGCNVAAPLP